MLLELADCCDWLIFIEKQSSMLGRDIFSAIFPTLDASSQPSAMPVLRESASSLTRFVHALYVKLDINDIYSPRLAN